MVLSLPDNPATHHIVDESALANGQLSGAGLDVFWQEPPEPQDALFSYNVIATPHIGGVTDISLDGNVAEVCENLRRLRDGEEILNRW